MKQSLVLFTADFPYGTGETFLETEIGYLCDVFEKVTIVSQNAKDKQTRTLPSNCIVQKILLDYSSTTSLYSLFQLFSPTFWKELKVINRVYHKKISLGIIKTMLISLKRGKEVKKYIYQNFGSEIEKTLFYSYWCDDTALGIGLLHAKNNNVKGITRIHRWDVYFEESNVNYLPFRHLIAEHLEKIASISKDGIEYAVQNWKIHPDNFILARLGINNGSHSHATPNRNPLKLVSCSNIIPVKRVLLIVEALGQIENFEIEWTHFGDGVLMEQLKEKINLLDKNISVHLPGRISNKDIYAAYEEMNPHLFINVSSSEGIPVSIMEAMSFGIPVIATDVGGNSEIVNNENGILLPADPSPKDIAREIIHFLEIDEQKYSTCSQNAFETWSRKYDAEKNYTDFTAYLTTL